MMAELRAQAVRVAVVDSGVHAEHPHVGGVAGGVGIAADGAEHPDFVDRLGHGTAVTAAIREKAPASEIFTVKVFDRELSSSVEALVAAIDWAARNGARVVNLSLGTANAAHADALHSAVRQAAERGAVVVAAAADGATRWLPGSLPGVVPVAVDWDCPREAYRWGRRDGAVIFAASGFPRPIPGVPPSRNLQGTSFAVANLTGCLVRALEGRGPASFDETLAVLTDDAEAR
jgi:subtilisin family serine protease|tara:strand:- start:7901 stop:8596 length:696 start_codon:yes stop_codon:yes gene_type:complete